MIRQVECENERRFLSFDLLYSLQPCVELGLYLLDNGMAREELRWFMSHGLSERIVLGNDYYETNEHVIAPGGEIRPAGEVFGWSAINPVPMSSLIVSGAVMPEAVPPVYAC